MARKAEVILAGVLEQHSIVELGTDAEVLVGQDEIGKKVNIYINDEFIFTSQVGKKSRIKIDKRSENGRKITNAILAGNKIRIFDSRG